MRQIRHISGSNDSLGKASSHLLDGVFGVNSEVYYDGVELRVVESVYRAGRDVQHSVFVALKDLAYCAQADDARLLLLAAAVQLCVRVY